MEELVKTVALADVDTVEGFNDTEEDGDDTDVAEDVDAVKEVVEPAMVAKTELMPSGVLN